MKGEPTTYQVKLWALAGPLISIFSLFILYIKHSHESLFFPLAILLGIPLCWRWKLWGAAASMIGLIFFMAMTYSAVPLEERFWFVGIGISICMSLLITALSFEEVEILIDSLNLESRSRLENLWKVDEKKKVIEEDLLKKKELIRELQIKVRSYQKLVDMSMDEMLEARSHHQQDLQELQYLADENRKLQVSLQMAENSQTADAKYAHLKAQYEESAKALDSARTDLFIANEKLLRIQRDQESRQYSLSEVEEALEQHMLNVVKERDEAEESHRREVEALQEMVERMIQERSRL